MERIFRNCLQFSPSPCKSLQEDWKVAAYPPTPEPRFTEDPRICTRDCRQVPVYPMYKVNPAIELRHYNFEIDFNLKQKLTFESKIVEDGKIKWIWNCRIVKLDFSQSWKLPNSKTNTISMLTYSEFEIFLPKYSHYFYAGQSCQLLR